MKNFFKGILLAIRGVAKWAVPVSALAFMSFTLYIAYVEPEAETATNMAVNGFVAVIFLVIQGVFSAAKGKISVWLFLLDLAVSGACAIVVGHILFAQEIFGNANTLSMNQEVAMWIFFFATVGDTVMGAINDGQRMILTDEMKPVE